MIKGYHIIRELHRGPITTAYLAVQTALDRQVLLKVLNEQWKDEQELIARFEREAKICARLQHPNIVTLYDFGTDNGRFYLTMEYVEGPTLEALIQQHHPLPIPVIELILEQIARGLSYAHQNGVIHRDIKPANILITPQGVVKIADFGLATVKSLPSVTMQGAVVGTPAFMAPELIAKKPPTPASDVFSLGVTLYQMVTQTSPFEGEHLADTIQRVLKHQPPPLGQQRADVPPYLEQLCQQMLEKSPEKRLSDGQAVLQAIQQHKPVYPDTLLADFLRQPDNFQPPESPAPPPPAGRSLPRWALLGLLLLVLGGGYWAMRYFSSPSAAPVAMTATDSLTVNPLQDTSVAVRDTIPTAQLQPVPTIKSEATPVAPSTPEPRDGRAAAPEPVGTGYLWLEVFPWAAVVVDGTPLDTTPLIQPLALSDGVHQLELHNPEFLPHAQTIRITPGQTDTLKIHLKPREGRLILHVSPWGKVFIDNRYVDTTPMDQPITLAPGKHLLRVENPNFPAWEDTIVIEPGQTLEQRIQLND